MSTFLNNTPAVNLMMPLVFDTTQLTAYSNQDRSNLATITDGGTTLRLQGDTWKKWQLTTPYTITANTILDFEFFADTTVTDQAIGFDVDNNFNRLDRQVFQLAGSRLNNFHYNPAFFRAEPGWQRRTIPVGQYFTGTFNHLVFINDYPHNAVGSGAGIFRNVRLYERNTADTVAPTVQLVMTDIINGGFTHSFQVTYRDNGGIRLSSLGNDEILVTRPDGFQYFARLTNINANTDLTEVVATYSINSNVGWGLTDRNGDYWINLVGDRVTDMNGNGVAASTLGEFMVYVSDPLAPPPPTPLVFDPALLSSYNRRDSSALATITDNGLTLGLRANTWKKYPINYTVTPDTVLRFEYRSDRPGREQAIGLETDDNYNRFQERAFQLNGTQPITWFYNTDFFNYTGSEWKTYEIEVGKYFTGTMDYLTFMNSNQADSGEANSFFRNVTLFDPFTLDTLVPTVTLESPPPSISFFSYDRPYRFTVTYQDNMGLDLDSLGDGDLEIIGPNGFTAPVKMVAMTPGALERSATVTYEMEGSFIYGNDYFGQYHISPIANQVLDIYGNAATSGSVGSFTFFPPVEMGINLARVADWSSAVPFIDAMNSARFWIPQRAGVWDTKEAVNVDENGWVTSIPTSGVTYDRVSTLLYSGIQGRYPGGQYVVLYDGEGTLTYGRNAVKDVAASLPGRDVINVTPSNLGILLSVTQTNPDNYLRNIRVVPIADEATYETAIFNPVYMDKLAPFSTLRFMEWMRTNGSPQTTWDTRATLDDFSWAENQGVPVEVMVEMANRSQSNPWFTIPHQATDDYVRSFAEYVRDNLDPDLTVYVEYSNEVWNGGFGQYHWVTQQALAEWGTSGNSFDKTIDWFSRRTTEVTRIWDEVFAQTNPERVIGVMGAWAAVSNWARRALQYNWTQNPLSHEDYGIDAVAIAPYFGDYVRNFEDQVSSWLSDPDGGLGKLFDEITQGGMIAGGPAGGALEQSFNFIRRNKAVAESQGLDLIAYEGGQHLVALNSGAVANLYANANRDPRMGQVYERYLQGWNELGLGGLFTHFQDIGSYTIHGSWGALESVFDEGSPKYDALVNYLTVTNAPLL